MPRDCPLTSFVRAAALWGVTGLWPQLWVDVERRVITVHNAQLQQQPQRKRKHPNQLLFFLSTLLTCENSTHLPSGALWKWKRFPNQSQTSFFFFFMEWGWRFKGDALRKTQRDGCVPAGRRRRHGRVSKYVEGQVMSSSRWNVSIWNKHCGWRREVGVCASVAIAVRANVTARFVTEADVGWFAVQCH